MDPFSNPFGSSVEQHRDEAPDVVTAAVLTISDTRTKDDDTSGEIIRTHLGMRGHSIAGYEIVPDEHEQITSALDGWIADPAIQVIVTNGGTGISGRDVTFPAVCERIEKPLPGFGEIFRMLSWDEVGPATILSRAVAGVAGNTLIFSIPGSPNAVKLAMQKIIAPELGHIVSHALSNPTRSTT